MQQYHDLLAPIALALFFISFAVTVIGNTQDDTRRGSPGRVVLTAVITSARQRWFDIGLLAILITLAVTRRPG